LARKEEPVVEGFESGPPTKGENLARTKYAWKKKKKDARVGGLPSKTTGSRPKSGKSSGQKKSKGGGTDGGVTRKVNKNKPYESQKDVRGRCQCVVRSRKIASRKTRRRGILSRNRVGKARWIKQ